MPEENAIQDPEELETANPSEEQIEETPEQDTGESEAPSFEDQLDDLVKTEQLDGRWGDKRGLELAKEVLKSYRNMEQYVGRLQTATRQPQQGTAQAQQTQQQTTPDDFTDRFFSNAPAVFDEEVNRRVQQAIPAAYDRMRTDEYVSEFDAPTYAAVDEIMIRNQLPYTLQAVKYAHNVHLGKAVDQHSMLQQARQQGLSQGEQSAKQKRAAAVEGGHKATPRSENAPPLDVLAKKYGGVGNIPLDVMEKAMDQIEGKHME